MIHDQTQSGFRYTHRVSIYRVASVGNFINAGGWGSVVYYIEEKDSTAGLDAGVYERFLIKNLIR